MNLLLIFGGVSSEHDISVKSAKSIINNIDKSKYNLHIVYITKEGSWRYIGESLEGFENVKTQAILSMDRTNKGLILLGESNKIIKIDCIFPVLHGKNGEDGTIQGLFEIANIPYVGCSVASSANAMDKSITKVLVGNASIPQSPYVLIIKSTYDENVSEILNKFEFPMFVKPCSSGSSVGVSKVKNEQELKDAITYALKFDSKILVEKNITGREVEVAVLGNDDIKTSVVGEIEAVDGFYSFDAKYVDNTSQTYIPARISEQTSDKLREYAKIVYQTLGCSGLSRVDFFVTENEEIIFNEINTLPGFTNISMYPKLFEQTGIKYSDLLDKIIQLALERGDKIGQ